MSGLPDYHVAVFGPGVVPASLERRSTIQNDNGVEDGTAPPSSHTEITYRGKFYPRGCRGMIEQIQIYCKRTGSGTLVLRYSPHPVLGPLGSVTVTPGSTWAWVDATVEKMWNYDSLFIWVYTCSADVSFGYDAVKPYDGHKGNDNGGSWEDNETRPFIRAVYTGETLGDMPISGVVNNIPLPHSSIEEEVDPAIITEDVLTTVVTIHGAGYVDLLVMFVWGSADAGRTIITINCDGEQAFSHQLSTLSGWGFNGGTQPICLPLYQADDNCIFMLTKKWEFKRLFEVQVKNTQSDQTVTIYTYPTLLR